MSKFKIAGLFLIILGVAMLFLGASLFSYSGPPLNPIVDKLGMYSFLFWLPVLIIGIVIFRIKKNKK
jgi:hypothetical protein